MPVEVILKQPIQGLGVEADIVKVKAGYARNFLLPKNLAIPATSAGKKQIEDLKKTPRRARSRGTQRLRGPGHRPRQIHAHLPSRNLGQIRQGLRLHHHAGHRGTSRRHGHPTRPQKNPTGPAPQGSRRIHASGAAAHGRQSLPAGGAGAQESGGVRGNGETGQERTQEPARQGRVVRPRGPPPVRFLSR
ncbi:MAG: hypothetical protein HC901_02495 [Bdellovibrionaceae bacterium]|nr:hypothetical protein [Pseudobdellovibrionaceae bacterium]